MITTQETRLLHPSKYQTALKHVWKVRPRFDVDSWTEADAAKSWFPDWNPEASNSLPSSLVMAAVARLFVQESITFSPFRRFWRTIGRLEERSRGICKGPIRWHELLHALHCAIHPTGNSGGMAANSGIDVLEKENTYYCGRKTCKHRNSILNGCIHYRAFERLVESGLVVPWSSVRWEGIGTLFTHLRVSGETPYISVRNERSHSMMRYVPYYVAGRIELFSRLIPSLLLQPGNVTHSQLAECLDRLSSERLRFYAIATYYSDPAVAMAQWDKAFTDACWRYGVKGFGIYERYEPEFWTVDEKTLGNLVDTEPDNLFPEIAFEE